MYKSTGYRKYRKIKPSFQSKAPPYCISISVISYFTILTIPVFMRFPGLLSAILTVKNLVINFTQILTKMVLQQRGSLLHSFQTVVKLTCWTKVVKVHCFRCSLAILQSSKSNERQKYHSRREEEKKHEYRIRLCKNQHTKTEYRETGSKYPGGTS